MERPGPIAGFRSKKRQYTASHEGAEIRGVPLPQTGWAGVVIPSRAASRAASWARLGRAGLWAMASLVTLAACQPQDHISDGFLQLYATKDPIYSNFYECHGYGCIITTRIALTDDEWQRVRAEFEPFSADARQERRQIADAVALLERLVGARTGTSAHQWSRSKFHINGNPQIDPTQLDCIDEAVNTWTYLTMIAREGLLRHHAVEKLAYAGGLPDFNFDLRNTAVIRATASGTYFAIDPTLVDAGEPPPIFPLSIWLGRWPPSIPAKDEID